MKNSSHAGETPGDVLVVLLAAGAGSRFSDTCHKLLAPLSKTAADPTDTVFARSLAHAVEARLGPVVVVTGALDATSDPRLADLLTGAAVVVRHNDRWADGQSTSVRVGIDAARERGATSVVVGLADQPFVTPEAWRAVAAGEGAITVATYDGRRGNPVRLHTDVWDLLPTSGDEGARVLMRARPDLVAEVPCTGSPADIDTLEDLHRWQNN
jgi:CTP:molybdopterin cytidylyltransferase MocA